MRLLAVAVALSVVRVDHSAEIDTSYTPGESGSTDYGGLGVAEDSGSTDYGESCDCDPRCTKCAMCKTGKACGNGCIDRDLPCHAEDEVKDTPFCACNVPAYHELEETDETDSNPHHLDMLWAGNVPPLWESLSDTGRVTGAGLTLTPDGGLEVAVVHRSAKPPRVLHDSSDLEASWKTEHSAEDRATALLKGDLMQDWVHTHAFGPEDRHKVLTVAGAAGFPEREQLYLRTSDMCGAGLFTQPKLSCEALTGASLAHLTRLAPGVAGPQAVPQRAFGVELELVGRKPSEDQVYQNNSIGGAVRYVTGGAVYGLAQSFLNSDFFERRVRRQVEASRAETPHHLNKKDPESYQEIVEQGDRVLETLRATVSRDWADLYADQMRGLPSLRHCAAQKVQTPAPAQCETHADCPLDHFCMACDDCRRHQGVEQQSAWRHVATARRQLGRGLHAIGGLVDRLRGYANIDDSHFAEAAEDAVIPCPQCRSPGQQVCLPRTECNAEMAVGGFCPPDVMQWSWTADVSVELLKESEVRQVTQDEALVAGELVGVGFELISPAPPHVLAGTSGVYGVAEQVGLLQSMGIQAGPTQGMHVHVNVGKPGHATADTQRMGADLTPQQIANVWVQYAKYQFVIDEMLQGSRVENHYAHGLYFGLFRSARVQTRDDGQREKVASISSWAENVESIQRAQSTFGALWNWVNWLEPGDLDDALFCDSVLTGKVKLSPDDHTPCSERYPHQRYSQVNLAALNRLGTMEFRAFPATTDGGRIVSWVTFLLKFVEHFKDATHPFFHAGKDGLGADRAEWEARRKQAMQTLANAQIRASRTELEEELDMDLGDLFSKRWEHGNPACAPQEWTKDVDDAEADAANQARKFIKAQTAGDLLDITLETPASN